VKKIQRFGLLAPLALLSLTACSDKVYKSLPSMSKPPIILKSVAPVEFVFKEKALSQIIDQPDVQASITKLSSLNYSVQGAKAAFSTNITASADGGLIAEDTDASPAINPSINATRTLMDGGIKQSGLDIANLNLKLAQYETALIIDEKLAFAIEANISQEYVTAVNETFEEFEKYYELQEENLQQAVSFGAVSQLQMLNLSQRLLAIEAQKISVKELELNIKNLLQKSSDTTLIIEDNFIDTDDLRSKIEASTVPVLALSKITENIAENRILSALGKGQMGVSTVGRLSKSSSDGIAIEAFAGVQVSIPIFDGGRLDAEVLTLKTEKESIVTSNKATKKRIIEGHDLLSLQQNLGFQKISLTGDQLEKATEKRKMNEDLLVSGQINLSEIVESFIKELELKIELADNQLKTKLRQLDMLKNTGLVCSAISACEEIIKFTSTRLND
jgi:outer membrane protein TolC